MFKRWAAWPRGIQWLAGIGVTVLALAIVWALFVPAADWLAHHDVGSVGGSLHETAVDNARGRLLTLGAGLFAAGALVFTALNFTVSRRTFDLTEQGQVTDRYTKAIGQLGAKKLDVRIGGIYALERVARDSAIDHPTVMEVLTAFIREYSHKQWPPPGPGGEERERSTRPDVQAALTVVGRRDPGRDIRSIDLTNAVLPRADLKDAVLAGADLTDAILTNAVLLRANLTLASAFRADLTNANLEDAVLTGAQLRNAVLAGAVLAGADLTVFTDGANRTWADLEDAVLVGAVFGDVNFTGANLTRADLTGTHLTRAHLTGANLSYAKWPEGAPIPPGYTPDPDSGRLKPPGARITVVHPDPVGPERPGLLRRIGLSLRTSVRRRLRS